MSNIVIGNVDGFIGDLPDVCFLFTGGEGTVLSLGLDFVFSSLFTIGMLGVFGYLAVRVGWITLTSFFEGVAEFWKNSRSIEVWNERLLIIILLVLQIIGIYIGIKIYIHYKSTIPSILLVLLGWLSLMAPVSLWMPLNNWYQKKKQG